MAKLEARYGCVWSLSSYVPPGAKADMASSVRRARAVLGAVSPSQPGGGGSPPGLARTGLILAQGRVGDPPSPDPPRPILAIWEGLERGRGSLTELTSAAHLSSDEGEGYLGFSRWASESGRPSITRYFRHH